jgi:hypothetical protein
MASKYLPEITKTDLEQAQASADKEVYFDLLCQPLHEELYRRQDFIFLDDLSEAQQLMLSFDYTRQQVFQGGFIQLIENRYIGLLPPMPAWLNVIGAREMAQVIDDALKVYVLNHEMLDKKTTIEEFAQLYEELKEFEIIDDRFHKLSSDTVDKLLDYATNHIEEFAKIKS